MLNVITATPALICEGMRQSQRRAQAGLVGATCAEVAGEIIIRARSRFSGGEPIQVPPPPRGPRLVNAPLKVAFGRAKRDGPAMKIGIPVLRLIRPPASAQTPGIASEWRLAAEGKAAACHNAEPKRTNIIMKSSAAWCTGGFSKPSPRRSPHPGCTGRRASP